MVKTLTAFQAAQLIKKVEKENPHYFADEDDVIEMFKALDDPSHPGHSYFNKLLREIQAA